jgi:hypothetical protein
MTVGQASRLPCYFYFYCRRDACHTQRRLLLLQATLLFQIRLPAALALGLRLRIELGQHFVAPPPHQADEQRDGHIAANRQQAPIPNIHVRHGTSFTAEICRQLMHLTKWGEVWARGKTCGRTW